MLSYKGNAKGLVPVYLYETSDRFAICGHYELLISVHNLIALRPRQVVLWQVQIDFIPIKVRIEGVAVGIVHANHPLALCTLKLMSVNGQPECQAAALSSAEKWPASTGCGWQASKLCFAVVCAE